MKLKKCVIILIAIFILSTKLVFATSNPIIVEGEDKVKIGETKNLSIKISSDKEIGLVSGKIEKNENVTSLKVTGENGWNLTYNNGTGVFNIYKAEGAKTEQIMSIEYTVASTEGKGTIKLSNIELTTIDYQTINASDIIKEITIEKGEEVNPPQPEKVTLSAIEISKAPTKTTYTEGEKFDISGMVVKANYSNGTSKEINNYTYTPNIALKTTDSKVIISYTEDGITKTAEQKITVKEKTVSGQNQTNQTNQNSQANQTKPTTNQQQSNVNQNKTTLPYTGVSQGIVFVILIIGIIAIVSYKWYRKYSEIK